MGVKKNSLVDLFQRETVVTMEIPNPHSTSLGREEKGAKESLTQPKERERDVKKSRTYGIRRVAIATAHMTTLLVSKPTEISANDY